MHAPAAPAPKRAWPGQQIGDPELQAKKQRFLERKIQSGTAAPEHHAALREMQRQVIRSEAVQGHLPRPPEPVAKPPRDRRRILWDEIPDVREFLVVSPLPPSPSTLERSPPQLAAEPRAPPQLAAEIPQATFLRPGSSKPHAAEGSDSEDSDDEGPPPTGSLRHLEPETSEALLNAPFPVCNVPKRTDPEKAPPGDAALPGPFTTAELIPNADRVVADVLAHGRAVQECLARASRGGPDAWKEARKLRPEAYLLSEEQALSPQARGFPYHQPDPSVDQWFAVQPGRRGELNVKGHEALKRRFGCQDQQYLSWVKQGFPGSKSLPLHVSLAFPHVGALKHPAELLKLTERDEQNGYASKGTPFPQFWPPIVDPLNVVVQKDKARVTIDKTMQHSNQSHPVPFPSYNSSLDLKEERERVGDLELPSVSIFGRGVAILATAGLSLQIGKFDKQHYFRKFGKDGRYVHQSQRLTRGGFSADFCVNFGEGDAMDHTCRGSDQYAYWVRRELRRLDWEYPPKVPELLAWLAHRSGLAQSSGQDSDELFQWALLFYYIIFVDDSGLAVIDDGGLHDRNGQPLIRLITDSQGVQTKVHVTRPELYFEAAMGIVNSCGHPTPCDKRFNTSHLRTVDCNRVQRLELLGIDIDLAMQRLLLTRSKRDDYLELVSWARRGDRLLPNHLACVQHDPFDSLVHKLTHASCVIAMGRFHLYYCRKACRAPNRLRSNEVIIDHRADRELEWWELQLPRSDSHGLPLASRWDFPCSSESTIVRYSDASREPDEPVIKSGFGAWAVIRRTFVYTEGRWTADEIKRYSINVLEAKARDLGAHLIIPYAQSRGLPVTHTVAYVDNTTAELVAERGRPGSDGGHDINLQRVEWLAAQGISEKNKRVASIDNDVADLLSRGDIEEALRFPREAGLKILKLDFSPEERSLEGISPTWA